jgi:hypothetical protein
MTEMTLDVLYMADQSSGKDALSRHGRLGMLPRILHLSVNALEYRYTRWTAAIYSQNEAYCDRGCSPILIQTLT